MKMEIYGLMDPPGCFDSVEEWEQQLERVKRLPTIALLEVHVECGLAIELTSWPCYVAAAAI